MALVDPRVKKQAEILVDYSLKVKKGENVVIQGEYSAKPLMFEIYKLLVKRGAGEVKVRFEPYEFGEYFLKNASMEQIKHFPQTVMDETKKMDCYIRIGSEANTRAYASIDSKRVSERLKVLRPITDYRVENTRWVVTRFPTEAQAQEADMSLADYEDFLFNSINKPDWKKKFKEQEKLRKLIDKTKVVRIVGEDTDLVLGKKGRNSESDYGTHNMPGGEVFTSVEEDKADGHIKFTYPAIYMGREYVDVRLEFKKGKVVKATASKGEKELNDILSMDEGAKRIGELGIGNNFEIDRFTKSILFDEKIGGTIHLALGKGYKETGSKNISALHWDMIKDLRRGGELWFDDKLVQKEGKWLIKL